MAGPSGQVNQIPSFESDASDDYPNPPDPDSISKEDLKLMETLLTDLNTNEIGIYGKPYRCTVPIPAKLSPIDVPIWMVKSLFELGSS